MHERFKQPAPALGNQYADDRVLRSFLRRAVRPAILGVAEPDLYALGELAAGELYRLQLADRHNEPTLTQWGPWGERVDHVDLSPLWRRAVAVAAQCVLVAIPYERRYGASRLVQLALAYLFHPSTDVYTCPLAIGDGAARTLLQWMTELPGGSDVGGTETVARPGADGLWRLHGRKWFTSAVTSQMALALARRDGAPPPRPHRRARRGPRAPGRARRLVRHGRGRRAGAGRRPAHRPSTWFGTRTATMRPSPTTVPSPTHRQSNKRRAASAEQRAAQVVALQGCSAIAARTSCVSLRASAGAAAARIF